MDKMEMKKMLANGYERVAYTNNYIVDETIRKWKYDNY